MLGLAVMNAVTLELPSHVKIHELFNVIHAISYSKLPSEISAPILQHPDPVPPVEGITTKSLPPST